MKIPYIEEVANSVKIAYELMSQPYNSKIKIYTLILENLLIF